MSSKEIQPRTRGSNISKLPAMMRMFVEELMADEQFNATTAARKAGYKRPGHQAVKLLKDRRVQAILGKALQERITRCRLTADEVLEHLRQALFLDPLELFERTPEGGFLVRSLEDIPVEVRRCITKIKQRQRIVGEGVETYVEVELMSKDAALQSAMKHLGLMKGEGTDINLNVAGIDLAALVDRLEQERRNTIDGIAIKRIAEGE